VPPLGVFLSFPFTLYEEGYSPLQLLFPCFVLTALSKDLLSECFLVSHLRLCPPFICQWDVYELSLFTTLILLVGYLYHRLSPFAFVPTKLFGPLPKSKSILFSFKFLLLALSLAP